MRAKLSSSIVLSLFMAGSAVAAVPSIEDKAPKQASGDFWQAEKEGGCKALQAADSTKLGLIRQMLTTGKPHAAIAYLDAAKIQAPQADLLRADGLRQTGRQDEAETLYRRLLKTCVAGYAYQGLGLSASKAGKTREAADDLKAASLALPIDAAIRNDYGYALMTLGDTQAALHEFLTAIELAPENRLAANNLVMLLSRLGDVDKAQAMAQRFGMTEATLERLRLLAQQPAANAAVDEDAIKAVVVEDAETLPKPEDSK